MTALRWLMTQILPTRKAKEAEARVDEALLAREDKRSAVSRLVTALEKVEIERDLDLFESRSVKGARRD